MVGWKVTGQEVTVNTDTRGRPKKQVVLNWEERTVDDSFRECSLFAHDLAVSLEERLERCTVEGMKGALFFDIDAVFALLTGQRLQNGKFGLKEGGLEEHGGDSFKKFFAEICNLPVIKSLDDPNFDARLSSAVLRDWKKSLRKLVWEKEMTQELLGCLQPVKEGGCT